MVVMSDNLLQLYRPVDDPFIFGLAVVIAVHEGDAILHEVVNSLVLKLIGKVAGPLLTAGRVIDETVNLGERYHLAKAANHLRGIV